MKKTKKPLGFYLIPLFLLIGVIVLETIGISLLLPGTVLDKIWLMNPSGYEQIAPFKISVGFGFSLLGLIFIFTIVGWLKRQKWGWWMTFGIFVANGAGDIVRLAKNDILGGIIGLCIAGLILVYLTRPRIKNLFT